MIYSKSFMKAQMIRIIYFIIIVLLSIKKIGYKLARVIFNSNKENIQNSKNSKWLID